MPKRVVCGARCPAAGSIRQALNRAILLVETEFKVGRQSPFKGTNCSTLRTELECRKALLLVDGSESYRRTLKQVLKSCNRFFDVPCKPCDKRATARAVNKWAVATSLRPEHTPGAPASWSENPIGELKTRVRRLLYRAGTATDWGEGIEERRKAIWVPDPNGCAELSRGFGGTFSVPPTALDSYEVSRSTFALRRGCAKTKGKMRVVTMQRRVVKETLGPLHEHLYDFLSRRKWLVRGEVNRDHVRGLLKQMIPGERYISGDYEAATDNIYVDAVKAIVDVIAESPHLTEKEREILVGSFTPENLYWVGKSGGEHPINRGSMMGNLMSFNVLCLLNKACFDIMTTLRRKRGDIGKAYRYPLINGDDIAFTGDTAAYDLWVQVTSHFGLVVNREKTGVSDRFVELNSTSFLVGPTGAVRRLRKPVLSALLPGNSPSCLLSRLWDGLRTLSPGSLRMAIVILRHQIAKRGVSLSSIPTRLSLVLLKDRWFRNAIFHQPAIKSSGEKRHLDIVSKEERPSEDAMPLYDELCDAALRACVERWNGIEVLPYGEELDSSNPQIRRHMPGRIQYCRRFVWRWPEVVWDQWSSRTLPVRALSQGLYEDDHPHLSIKVDPILRTAGYPPPVALLTGVTIHGFVFLPNGLV